MPGYNTNYSCSNRILELRRSFFLCPSALVNDLGCSNVFISALKHCTWDRPRTATIDCSNHQQLIKHPGLAMQAVYQGGWGGREQLSVREVARPSPGKGSVLVRVKAVSINAGDHHLLTGRPYVIRCIGRPDIPGLDFSGVVESVGTGVERMAVGDDVLGTADIACGAFAEYVCVKETNVVHKPKGVDWEAAATVATAGETALQALRTGRAVTEGDRVLINGASGGVGSFAVQLAKSMGAHVTGVCSTDNIELVRSLGADEVVDYKTESVDSMAAANGKYDKIIDAVGRPGWRQLLKPGGAVVAVSLPHPEWECVPFTLCEIVCSPWCCCCLSSKKSLPFMQSVKVADMQELAGMLSEGSLRAVLGRRLVGIGEIPDALAGHSTTLGQGHCVGKTVVSIGVTQEKMQRE